jgi:sterol desaturase/sphingolipid hydroxylase (fatty acid hydroxylase superfamily)
MDYLPHFSNIILAPLEYFSNPGSRVFVLYLATSLLIALYLHLRASRVTSAPEGPIAGIFPRKVYTHRSAMVDYIYFITNTILYAIIIAPFAGFGLLVSNTTQSALQLFMTPHVMADISPLWATVIFSLTIALIADFGTFYSHYWMHRVPLLWEFHKVHHSAEVLTPITVHRMHPLDDIVTLLTVGLLSGVADALARFFITPNISNYTVYGLGIASFLFFLGGYHLRHSHIWLSYGPKLSKLLISPAQHQIHHSKAKRHWNKNYGFIFALWDWMFGSLYVPQEREHLEFGIGNGEESLYSSPLKLYFLPFKRAFNLFRKRSHKAP